MISKVLKDTRKKPTTTKLLQAVKKIPMVNPKVTQGQAYLFRQRLAQCRFATEKTVDYS